LIRGDFDAFCRAAFDLLAAARVRYLVIGGLAVVAVGEPRLTGDVDVVAFPSAGGLDRLLGRARAAGFEFDEGTERERLEATGTLRFRRSPFQLDVIRASLPFEDTALARSFRKRLFGRLVRLPTPEDLLLFKVLAGRDKDLLDAVGIVRRHGERLDLDYVRATLRPICDLAESMDSWRRLDEVLRKARTS
jgi:hypothetical protein